jgi:hypothetical protein
LINRAILDKQKVEEAIQKVETIVQIVPKADEWMTKTQEYRLTPKDVERTLQRAFVSPEPCLEPLPEQDEVRPILGIAANALRRAREFRAKDGTFEREETLLRMVAYASIEVSIVVEEATVEQVSEMDIVSILSR